MLKRETFGEMFRFAVVGTISTVLTRNGIGFGGAHLFNYCLHIVLLNFFLWVGLSRELAPLGVYAIAVPTNFFVVRFVFKHFHRS